MSNYIPAIITASVALIAAVGAQFLNNGLTLAREKINYNKLIHKELISKHLSSLIKNAYVYNNPYDEDQKFPFPTLKEVVVSMEKDLQYFNPQLQIQYSYYSVNGFIEGASEEIEKRLEFEIAFYFLIYAIEVFESAKIKTNENYLGLLEHVATRYAYLAIGTEVQGYSRSRDNLIALNRFFLNSLNHYSLKDYERVINSDYMLGAKGLVSKINADIDNHIS